MTRKKRYYDKKQSQDDSSMISGATGQANMPQNVIRKFYPSHGSYLPESIQDGISAIDSQMKGSVSDTKKNLSKEKY